MLTKELAHSFYFILLTQETGLTGKQKAIFA